MDRIDRMDPAGTGAIAPFAAPAGSEPAGITIGPDGNLWFTEYEGHQIGRMTLDGTVTEFPVPTAGNVPYGIVTGPDGNLWFTESRGNKIGRIAP
jgi:virginiamycin B lyase